MNHERAMELLKECVRCLSYEDRDRVHKLCETIGFTNEDLEALGYGELLNDEYAVFIIDATANSYVIEETNGESKLGDYESRLLFFNEADAEAALARLNDNSSHCFSMIHSRY